MTRSENERQILTKPPRDLPRMERDQTGLPMPFRTTRRGTLAALFVLGLPAAGLAQGLDLTINHVGIGIGDVPEVIGLRLNYRDEKMRRVDGVNATIWSPYGDNPSGVVRGIALGLPITGAGNIDGLAVGLFGVIFVLLLRIIPPPRPDVGYEYMTHFFETHHTTIRIGLGLLCLVFGGHAVANGFVTYHVQRMSSGPTLAYVYMGGLAIGMLAGVVAVVTAMARLV